MSPTKPNDMAKPMPNSLGAILPDNSRALRFSTHLVYNWNTTKSSTKEIVVSSKNSIVLRGSDDSLMMLSATSECNRYGERFFPDICGCQNILSSVNI
jgi:hypothetical protein